MCSGSAFSGTGNKSKNFTEFAKNLVRSFNTDPSGIRKAVVDATSCFEGPEHRDDPFAQNMNAAKRLLTKLDHIYRSSTVTKPQGGITLRFARPDTVQSFIDGAMGRGSITPSDAKATEFGPPYRGRNLDDYLNRLQGLDIQRVSPTHSAYWESGAQLPLHTCSPVASNQPGALPATSRLVFDLRPGRAGFMTDTASPGRLGKSHPLWSAPIVYPGSRAIQSLGGFKLTKWKSCTFRSGEIQVTIAISCKQEGNEVIYRADVCGGVSFSGTDAQERTLDRFVKSIETYVNRNHLDTLAKASQQSTKHLSGRPNRLGYGCLHASADIAALIYLSLVCIYRGCEAFRRIPPDSCQA